MSNVATFNLSGVFTPQTVSLNAGRATQSLVFGSTGAVTIQGGGTLTINTPSPLGNGPVTIAKSGAATGTVALALTATNTINNTLNGPSPSTPLSAGRTCGAKNVAGNN